MSKKNCTLLISTPASNSTKLLDAISGMQITNKKVLPSLVDGITEILYITVQNDGIKPSILGNLEFPVRVNQA